jgi:hypothetical protein
MRSTESNVKDLFWFADYLVYVNTVAVGLGCLSAIPSLQFSFRHLENNNETGAFVGIIATIICMFISYLIWTGIVSILRVIGNIALHQKDIREYLRIQDETLYGNKTKFELNV